MYMQRNDERLFFVGLLCRRDTLLYFVTINRNGRFLVLIFLYLLGYIHEGHGFRLVERAGCVTDVAATREQTNREHHKNN